MIELLLSYNVDTGEALLHAIDEEFVEGKVDNDINIYLTFLFLLTAVELLLQHEDLKQQQQQPTKDITSEDYTKVSRHYIEYLC
jgi:hypothetical protein